MRDRIDLNKDQLKAFESPVKATLVTALRAHEKLTIRELAGILGVKPESLYYHVRTLLKLELLEVESMRPAETKPEAVYQLTAKEFYMDNLAKDLEYERSVFRSAKNITGLALRRYEAAVVSGESDALESIRFSFAGASMSDESIEQLKAELRELGRRVLATKDPGGKPVLFTALFVPTETGAERN